MIQSDAKSGALVHGQSGREKLQEILVRAGDNLGGRTAPIKPFVFYPQIPLSIRNNKAP